MNGDKNSLPEVKAVPGETIARFRAVGVDEAGQTLYQKLEYSQISHEAEKLTVSHSKIETKVIKPLEQTESLSDDNQKETARIASQYKNLTPLELKDRHNQSKLDYPEIADLGDNEFVLVEIKRLPILAKLIWAAWLSILVVITSAWLILSANRQISPLKLQNNVVDFFTFFTIIVLIVDILVLIFAYIGHKIYTHNKMFVTSERVIQFKMNSLFDEKVQSIDLNSIEDVSYHQKGLLANLFNFGSVRMSTVGDESSYYLTLVARPDAVAKSAAAVVQAVKNDRLIPVNTQEINYL